MDDQLDHALEQPRFGRPSEDRDLKRAGEERQNARSIVRFFRALCWRRASPVSGMLCVVVSGERLVTFWDTERNTVILPRVKYRRYKGEGKL